MITTLEPILAEHPFFSGLLPEYLKLVTGCASNVRFDAGQQIARAGEEANSFYIIRQGKAAVEVFAPGRGTIMVETLGEGDVLGWSWLFPPYRTHFDSRALELTRAIALDGKCLRTKCEADPALGFELLKRVAGVMVQRLQAARLQLLDVYGSKRK
jgi:CRP-like cAMP-binding protein